MPCRRCPSVSSSAGNKALLQIEQIEGAHYADKFVRLRKQISLVRHLNAEILDTDVIFTEPAPAWQTAV